MATVRIGSAGVNLPTPGINANLYSNQVRLAPGEKWTIPSGQFTINLGPYTTFQVFDPIIQNWVIQEPNTSVTISSDGVNYRLANLTGCVVGALVTTAGTGYLTAPTITPSAGGATFRAILGGTVSTTATIATAGAGYTHPPTLRVSPPPAGGVQASAVATVSGGAVSAVTITDQGAGYTTAPTVLVEANPVDTITTAAAITLGLTANVSTNLSAIVCTDPGTALTSVPTLTISAAPAGGTTAVATAIMMFTATGFSAITGGSNYGNTQPYVVYAPGTIVAGTQATTNPNNGTGLYQTRPTSGYGTTGSTGVPLPAQVVITDGGLHQAVPTGIVSAAGTFVPTVYAVGTYSVGGVNDISFVQQI
jgi:hypothetical protein